MKLSTSEAVGEVFKRALQEHLQNSLRTGEDWDSYKSILRETDARLMSEQAAYKRDFSQRMAEAKQIILREESGVRLDQPLPPRAQKHSDADQLDRKAGIRVQQDHDRRVAVIKKDELGAFRELTAKIRARDATAPSFSQTRDRTGPSQS